MGQKVNPNGFRVGVIRDWNTCWYASKKEFSDFLIEDKKIRDHLKKAYYAAGVSRIEIKRAAGKVNVSIYTGRPGMLIGKGGVGVDLIKAEVTNLIKKPANVNIMEIKNPDADAQLVAENIAAQLEKRIAFRRAMKQSLGRTMKAGAKGIKVSVAGRLNGADIARSEGYHEGSIPLQTLRANIDYGFSEAKTTYGRIGVKVWIYKGQVLPNAPRRQDGTPASPRRFDRPERSERPERRDRRTDRRMEGGK
jgi:small subunit ribosomal protein S3